MWNPFFLSLWFVIKNQKRGLINNLMKSDRTCYQMSWQIPKEFLYFSQVQMSGLCHSFNLLYALRQTSF